MLVSIDLKVNLFYFSTCESTSEKTMEKYFVKLNIDLEPLSFMGYYLTLYFYFKIYVFWKI
jgi:hypothetical protein